MEKIERFVDKNGIVRKRYCPKGHDKTVVGVRESNRRCMECHRIHQVERDKRYRQTDRRISLEREYKRNHYLRVKADPIELFKKQTKSRMYKTQRRLNANRI